MTAWDEVRTKHTSAVRKLEGVISGYSYADHQSAALTDERLCNHLVKSLRGLKSQLFDLIQFVFELQADKVLDPPLLKLRGEIDHFSDEVKVRHFRWNDLPPEILHEVMEHDRNMIKRMDDLAAVVEKASDRIVGFKRVDHKVFDTKQIEALLEKAHAALKDVVVNFNVREAVFEMKGTDLKEVYKKVRKEVEEKY
jgi:hypothetical protein